MNDQGKLKYLEHSQVDYSKWNRCIMTASNSRIYAASWFLDRSAKVWDALVWGDYEFVMPLPFRRKFGIKYLYQPVFSQQLGIFPQPSGKIEIQFYKELLKRFRYCDIHLNSHNYLPGIPDVKDLPPRLNYLLPLKGDYEYISGNYSKNTKRNIARSGSYRLSYVSNINLHEYIEFNKKNLGNILSDKDINKLKSIIAYTQTYGMGEIPGVYNAENRLCATVFFCHYSNRVTYLNAGSDRNGKVLRSMFFLVDNYIRTNTGKNLVLDFEGSMLPGVARFFKGFGASPEYYYPLKFNKLPFPIRWLKR